MSKLTSLKRIGYKLTMIQDILTILSIEPGKTNIVEVA